MSLKAKFDQSARLLFTAKQPSLQNYLGRYVTVDGDKTQIKHITGNLFKPAFVEINGRHLIGFLRFFREMTGAKDISDEDCLKFEQMEVEARMLPLEEKTYKDVTDEETRPGPPKT